jgi:hypothetical protein
MKNFLKVGLIMLALVGMNASAQDWFHDREARFRGEEWRAHLFNHVRMDLDYVQNATWPGGKDMFRIDRTKEELNELQYNLDHGRYDEPKLDAVIGSLNKIVAYNHLGPQHREVMIDDLRRLRDYRAHHEHWIH